MEYLAFSEVQWSSADCNQERKQGERWMAKHMTGATAEVMFITVIAVPGTDFA